MLATEATSWSSQNGCSNKYTKVGRLSNISVKPDKYGDMTWTK